MRLAGFAAPAVLMLATAVAGCATYIDRIERAHVATASGDYQSAIASMDSVLGVDSADALPDTWSGDRPLAALERGMLQQALGRYPDSARDLSAAEQELELLDL